MPHKIVSIPQFRIKFNDVFHLRNLYVMMHEYLLEEGWRGKDGEANHSDIETFYLEIYFQKGLHHGGKEMWVWWRLFKRPASKYSGYFRYRLDIDMHMRRIFDIEIMHKGKKIKVHRGEIEIFFRPWIEGDLGDKWKKHWLLKHFQELFEKRIMSQEFEKHEKELWRETYRFQSAVKRFLDLRTFIPTPEPFHPKLFGMEP